MTKHMKPQSTKSIHLPDSGFLTPGELRTRWKVSAMFLWRMRQKGKLTAHIIGERGVRFSIAEVERIEQQSAT